MTKVQKATCWAAAILLNAAGNSFGLIADDVAQMLFVTLPVMAIVSLYGGGCALRPKGA